ncbi:MAG: TonB-dependent receptor [Balneolales bacterium]
MKKITLLFTALMVIPASWAYGQNFIKALVKDAETDSPLMGATSSVEGTTIGASANEDGYMELTNIPDGKQVIHFRYVGYHEEMMELTFPRSSSDTLLVLLKPDQEEMDEVMITSTRSSRTIADSPTRVEAISGEELAEKGNMKPGDIRMLLNESTGIQTRQTSTTSYNSSIRIQGLDGKYTQILKDGYPLYSGFSGGLSIMQIPPLDLRQVEVIKGSASTLYGGDAIAGLINLVSKRPSEQRELSFMGNGTTARGLDLSGFYSQKFNTVGATVFAAYNHGSPYDPSDVGLTAIPEFDRFTLNPRLFIYFNEETTLHIGFNGTYENRVGGDVRYFNGDVDNEELYFEENKTNRFSTQLGVNHILNETSRITFKNSISFYDRAVTIPDYSFGGLQTSSFSELSYSNSNETLEWVAGLNQWTDQFTEDETDGMTPARNHNEYIFGGFLQNTWNATNQLTLESGLRGDYQNNYGFFVLPRLSALFRFSPDITSRVGFGMGYKTPSIFTEDAERIQFRNVMPIDRDNTKAEESFGGNVDVNYRTTLFSNQIGFSLNQLLFYTRIDNPLAIVSLPNNHLGFRQANGYLDTRGTETNIKLDYNHFKLFIGYTFTNAREHYEGTTSDFPLVAKHRLNNVLIYEIEDNLMVGLEAYYFSPQRLPNGSTSRSYWLHGLMIEKKWEHFSLFINFENIFDVRQTRFDSIYTGSITDPEFLDLYAPLDGFVTNGGIKIRL